MQDHPLKIKRQRDKKKDETNGFLLLIQMNSNFQAEI